MPIIKARFPKFFRILVFIVSLATAAYVLYFAYEVQRPHIMVLAMLGTVWLLISGTYTLLTGKMLFVKERR